MKKLFTATIQIELSGMNDNYEPTRNDADQLIEMALGVLFNSGLNDGALNERIIFAGYPSIKVTDEEVEED